MKFDPVSKSITEIGPDFGDDREKWMSGAINGSGIIYCPPFNVERGILKIDTNTDTVTVLDRDLLPEQGRGTWASCAVALDGCIYFMPSCARRIMKLDPNNNDAISSVGNYLGDGVMKYYGTVVGIDRCLYGIPCDSKHIPKYDPINDKTSFVGEEADKPFYCTSDGALGKDGCIYAMTQKDMILKIDTTNHSHCFVGDTVESDHNICLQGWGDAILGIDGCIYWPPDNARCILKCDPHINQASLVGDDFGNTQNQWRVGALASDGVVYCIPSIDEGRILSIDPWREFCMTVKNNLEKHPQNFGFLFERPGHTGTKPSLHHVCKMMNFDRSVVKFGREKVIEGLDKYMTPVNDFCRRSNLCPFMIVASCKESSVCTIYHFLCQDLSWVNGIDSVEVKAQGTGTRGYKRKLEFNR